MLQDLMPLVVALAIAVAVYTAREARARRYRLSPPLPDLTMAEAWRRWLEHPAATPDAALLPRFSLGGVEAEVWRDLAALESAVTEAEHPRSMLRRAILDSASNALYLEAVAELGETERRALLEGYQEGMGRILEDALRVSAIKWIVLRQYARLKFDDAVAGDWFHRFMRLAEPYIREKVRFSREFLLHLDSDARRFAEVYDELLHDLRRDALQAMPKRRFPPPDLAAGRAAGS